MDLVVTLVTGGLIGWLASLLMRTDGQMGVLANILVGIVGSILGSWLAGVLGIAVAETQRDALRDSKRHRVNPLVSFGGLAPSVVPAEVMRLFGLHGPLMCTSTGCASGASAVVEGFSWPASASSIECDFSRSMSRLAISASFV